MSNPPPKKLPNSQRYISLSKRTPNKLKMIPKLHSKNLFLLDTEFKKEREAKYTNEIKYVEISIVLDISSLKLKRAHIERST